MPMVTRSFWVPANEGGPNGAGRATRWEVLTRKSSTGGLVHPLNCDRIFAMHVGGLVIQHASGIGLEARVETSPGIQVFASLADTAVIAVRDSSLDAKAISWIGDAFKAAAGVKTFLGLAALAFVCTIVLYCRISENLKVTKKAGGVVLLAIVKSTAAITALVVLVMFAHELRLEKTQHPEPAAPATQSPPVHNEPGQVTFNEDTLKNLTYVVEGEKVTLNDGKLEFDPQADIDHPNPVDTDDVYLARWAFGDLVGDGSQSAVAVLQQSSGGSGIFYYLVPVTSKDGVPRADVKGLSLGDRLQFKSVEVTRGKVALDVLMHRPDEPLSSPSWLRHLEFSYQNGRLICETKPCSEFPEADVGASPPPLQSLLATPSHRSASLALRNFHPSFNCTNATTSTEIAICSDEQLSDLDAGVGRAYATVVSATPPLERPAVRRDETQWIVERQAQCGADVQCIHATLLARMVALTSRQ